MYSGEIRVLYLLSIGKDFHESLANDGNNHGIRILHKYKYHLLVNHHMDRQLSLCKLYRGQKMIRLHIPRKEYRWNRFEFYKDPCSKHLTIDLIRFQLIFVLIFVLILDDIRYIFLDYFFIYFSYYFFIYFLIYIINSTYYFKILFSNIFSYYYI